MKQLTRLAVVLRLLGVGAGEARADAPGAPNTGSVTTVEESASGKLRFYGLSFDLTTADSSGLNAVGHNYRNDFVWYFEPAWNVGRVYLQGTRWQTLQFQARFTVVANVSGTDESNFGGVANAGPQGTCGSPTINDQGGTLDSGSVAYCNPPSNGRRADYSDLWLTLRAPRLYTIPKIGVYLNPAFRLVLPTSLESQFATMVMSLTPSIAAGRTFWHDKLRVGYGFGFTKYFHRYTTPLASPSGGQAAAQGGNPFDATNGAGLANFYNDPSRQGGLGLYNPDFALVHTISGGWQFNDRWSLDIIYLIIDTFDYGHSCTVQVNGTTYDTCAAGDAVAANSNATIDRPGRHDSQVFWATVAYQPRDWLGISLAWITLAPLLKPDSSYRQGLISTDYNGFTSVQLAATITIDRLVARYWRKQ